MKAVIIVTCLIAAIWAYHTKYDFNVVIDKVEFGDIPKKYKLDLSEYRSQIEELMKDVVPKIEAKVPMAASGTTAIMNDYADKIFSNLKTLMINSGFDPIEMPEQHSGFNYTLIITYHGELDLTQGWLQDLSTLHRGGDVIASYSSNTKYLEVTVPIAFDDLQFSYDYSAKIMGLGPVGGIVGKIKNIGVRATIGFDTANLVASLDEFYITNSGHIDINFNGNPLIDWLVNLLTDVVTALLKPLILLIVENVIRGGLDSAVEIINSVVDGILNPGGAAAAVDAWVYKGISPQIF